MSEQRTMKGEQMIDSHAKIFGTDRVIDKVTRYGWQIKDSPGELAWIPKGELNIDNTYQRQAIESKILAICSAWSWLNLGVIIVGVRDNQFWVIDGQHRVLAAKRRSDINNLPCVVFKTGSVQQEARGFNDTNVLRRPVSALDRYRALVVAGDETAAFVQSQLDLLGIKASDTAKKNGVLRCIGWCMKRAASDRETFIRVLSMVNEISVAAEISIPERLLVGTWYLHANCGDGLNDQRLVDRIRFLGAQVLLNGIRRAAAIHGIGGERIFAIGMLDEINKGLRTKFKLNEKPE